MGPAQEDLQIAWRILAPQAKAHMFAGVQGCLAGWWEVTARSRTPEARVEMDLLLSFTAAEVERLKQGLIPQQMEDK